MVRMIAITSAWRKQVPEDPRRKKTKREENIRFQRTVVEVLK